MNKEIAEKWVAALRSGKYRQGKAYLKENDRFCCLGVLCDISGLGEWIGNNYAYKETAESLIHQNRSASFCPFDLWYALGGIKDYNSIQSYLTKMNDTDMSFEKIADYIEANWEKL